MILLGTIRFPPHDRSRKPQFDRDRDAGLRRRARHRDSGSKATSHSARCRCSRSSSSPAPSACASACSPRWSTWSPARPHTRSSTRPSTCASRSSHPHPTRGNIELVTYPVKSGRLLFVGETLLHTGDLDAAVRAVRLHVHEQAARLRAHRHLPGRAARRPDSYDASLQVSEPVPGGSRWTTTRSCATAPTAPCRVARQALLVGARR